MDLEDLLHGSPSWKDVKFYFQNGEFFDEHYLIEAITKHLLTDDQRGRMHSLRYSIADMLNGRIEGAVAQNDAEAIFAEWNAKLGFHHFGA